ncbi:MAG: hypothetical protein SO001_01750, partial [Alloprevotella sp.]|nr:hypothetical protein [Alloprevotella sp.]
YYKEAANMKNCFIDDRFCCIDDFLGLIKHYAKRTFPEKRNVLAVVACRALWFCGSGLGCFTSPRIGWGACLSL